MRQKCLDCLEKPSPKKLKELTSMEQKWLAAQKKDAAPAPAKPKAK